MGKKEENVGFKCLKCGKEILAQTNGSYRNHCPFCLYSVHVDVNPGDRNSDCLGMMEPYDIIYNSAKGHQIVHRCLKCGFVRNNKVADDGVQPDDMDLILKIAGEKAFVKKQV